MNICQEWTITKKIFNKCNVTQKSWQVKEDLQNAEIKPINNDDRNKSTGLILNYKDFQRKTDKTSRMRWLEERKRQPGEKRNRHGQESA